MQRHPRRHDRRPLPDLASLSVGRDRGASGACASSSPEPPATSAPASSRRSAADPDVDEIVGVARRATDWRPPQDPLGVGGRRARRPVGHVRGRRRRHPPRLADPAQPRRARARARQRPRLAQGLRAAAARGRRGARPRLLGRRLLARPEGPRRRRVAPARRRPVARSTPATRRSPSASSTRSRDELRIVRLRPGLIFKREAGPEIRRLFAGPLLPGRAAQAGPHPRPAAA